MNPFHNSISVSRLDAIVSQALEFEPIYRLSCTKFLDDKKKIREDTIDTLLGDSYYICSCYLCDGVDETVVFTHKSKEFAIVIHKEVIRYWGEQDDDTTYHVTFYAGQRLSFAESHNIFQDWLADWSKEKEEEEAKIFFLGLSHGRVTDVQRGLSDVEVDLELNYNNSLIEIHDEIAEFLSSSSPRGRLLLFNGEPGTGKTFYLRHLIKSNPEQKFYFIPPNIFHNILDPSFINYILSRKNSIYIVEDAELLLQSREEEAGSMVSSLLQLSDGLVGDCCNNKFILSFNSSTSRIDKAALRKGRLFKHYEFGPLTVEKSNKLLSHLGCSERVTEPTTLGKLYNFAHDIGAEEKEAKKIGFFT